MFPEHIWTAGTGPAVSHDKGWKETLYGPGLSRSTAWILPSTHTCPTCNVPERDMHRGHGCAEADSSSLVAFALNPNVISPPQAVTKGNWLQTPLTCQMCGGSSHRYSRRFNFTPKTLHPLEVRPNTISCLLQWSVLDGGGMSEGEAGLLQEAEAKMPSSIPSPRYEVYAHFSRKPHFAT